MRAEFEWKFSSGTLQIMLLATVFFCAWGHPAQAQVTPNTRLLYSVSSTRAPSQPLNGSTVIGPVYVFTGLSSGSVAGTPPVSSVTYALDNGVFTHTENLAPFDFNGTVVPFTFPAGNHVITQTVTFTDGT